MKKILIVAKNVFFTRTLKPTYYWMIIAPLILSLGAFLFSQYISNQNDDNKPRIAIVAPNSIRETLKSNNNKKYILDDRYNNVNENKKFLIDGNLDGILYVSKDFKKAKFIYNNLSSAKMPFQDLQKDLNSSKAMITAQKLGLSKDNMIQLFGNTPLKEIAYNSGTKEEKPIYNGYTATQLFSEGATIILFFLLTSYISITGTEIGKEKGDHILESILASIPAKAHFSGKMLGITYLMLFQIFIYALIFGIAKILLPLFGKEKWLDFSQLKGITPQYAIITLILMITAIMLYVLFSSLVASFVSRTEDISQATSVVASCMMVPYFISFLTQDTPNNSISVTLSFIPFISHSIMPIRISRFATDYSSGWIAIFINIIAVFVMYFITSKVYCRNVFKYSKEKPLKSMISFIKK